MIIYNLFPPLAGTFSQWSPHIERAAQLGFDWLFVNPVQKPGYSESLYSVFDYFALNPRFVDVESTTAADKQLAQTLASAKKRGLRSMVDLVINHCAFDSPLTTEHPEWFVKDADGSLSRPSCMEDGKRVVWEDLVSFDHENSSDKEGMYRFFVKVIDYLIRLGFSGFRCDAAYQVPRPLWQRLIAEVKSRHPDTVFVAETLGCTPLETRETAQAGFDYVFNSSKWWDYQSPWMLLQRALVREIVPSISFPESHDTERLFAETKGSVGALKQRYLFAACLSAGVMLPIGYEFGFRRKLHVVETRPEHWEHTDIDLRDYIGKVNALKKRHSVFQEDGPMVLLPCDNPNVLLLWRASMKTAEEALLILNKDIWNRQHFQANLDGYIQNGAPLFDRSPEYPVKFISTPFSYTLNPGQGLVLVATPR